jgi:5-formyltetrahydrofolate cyclo-ligase
MNKKEHLRKLYLEKRKNISLERRQEAEHDIVKRLYSLLKRYARVLSFSSLKEEINLWPLNELLCKEKKLLLPRVEKDHLVIYPVEQLTTLIPSKIGILEPDPRLASPLDMQEASHICALIPGLAFDKEGHRLGYGKGHFDKLLASTSCKTIGVGFKEQLFEEMLPVESHDQKLDDVMLF